VTLSLVGDLSDREGYDFEQLRTITKILVRSGYLFFRSCAYFKGLRVQMATLLHTSEYEVHGWSLGRS
jgi:hypothetical protein